MHAREPLALRLDFGPGAAHLIHVGRRAADVADDALEFRVGGHLADFFEDRLLRPRLHDPALVGRDRAKRAAAEAAAHDRHRILDHLVGRDRLGVGRVRPARVGQVVNRVHLLFGRAATPAEWRRRLGGRGTAPASRH